MAEPSYLAPLSDNLLPFFISLAGGMLKSIPPTHNRTFTWAAVDRDNRVVFEYALDGRKKISELFTQDLRSVYFFFPRIPHHAIIRLQPGEHFRYYCQHTVDATLQPLTPPREVIELIKPGEISPAAYLILEVSDTQVHSILSASKNF